MHGRRAASANIRDATPVSENFSEMEANDNDTRFRVPHDKRHHPKTPNELTMTERSPTHGNYISTRGSKIRTQAFQTLEKIGKIDTSRFQTQESFLCGISNKEGR